MRRDLVLSWLICAAFWIVIAVTHDRVQVWNSMGLIGEGTSQLGTLRFWAVVVAFPLVAVLVALIVIDRLFGRFDAGRGSD